MAEAARRIDPRIGPVIGHMPVRVLVPPASNLQPDTDTAWHAFGTIRASYRP